ncbi:sulfatase-like hydrolase/transferase [Coraliomargarita algicola]|uniref:Sulfatase-like hydrolase/transferase n=1 Tax=Coraliomargarita algicola TaxID=3092156 RepID=A0ABZ0RVW8_9BACT|nr:sulfatase-like hydrolase/transferase [Coraliomargarita sp. J2-16]WPJ97129.1 sulfatase-like hydrolase/transferase [Coraliomargarita sp. J2-16]
MSVLKTLFYAPAICLATVGSLLASASQAEPERPNVVMIIVDDLGWRDLGCYGSELYQTPAVDALAAEGLSFSNAYASSRSARRPVPVFLRGKRWGACG